MSSSSPLIAVIGGVAEAAPPAMEAIAATIPDVKTWNVLDDRLISDAVSAGEVGPELRERMRRLVRHVDSADAILLTCSLYSFLAPELTDMSDRPVLGPDDDAMAAAADHGYPSVAVVSGVELAVRDSSTRLTALIGSRVATRVVSVLAPAARQPSLRRDLPATVDRISDALAAADPTHAVLLANYTLAFAADALAERLGRPVLTGPRPAALHLKRILQRAGSDT